MRVLSSLLLRLRRCCGAAVAWSFLGVASVSAAGPGGTVVKDPHYGDGLFHFFQEHYFTAVTGLMASQHFGRVSQHADEAEVLRGGLFLSFGLHREAGDIFARLIEQGAPPSVQDRAWYYLAKIRYQRGLLAQAEDALARIGTRLPAELEEDRALLHANVLMARADYAGAAKLLAAAKPGASAYARYNLGVALIKSGDSTAGSALLDQLGSAPAASEEMRSLRDQANVALGFAGLRDGNPERARSTLERVRLSGMHANKALLGFGWAAAELKQPKSALVPWMELAQRDASDAAVLEAKLAVAYATGELGAHGQSLQRYEDAITVFDREAANVDESVVAIRAGRLLDDLLAANPGEEMGWFWKIEQLPQMPHAGHLTQVLAQHEFQEGFKNFRDLLFLERNLQQWKDNLVAFGDMLANRRQGYAQRLPQVRTKEGALDIGSLEQRGKALAAELTQAEAQADGLAFSDDRERELLQRLERVRATLDRLADDPQAASARERLRRADGAMQWQLAEKLPVRSWQAKKGMQDVDDGLALARRTQAALARAQSAEPARFDLLAARIVELEKRIDALAPRIAVLAHEQQGHVQELAVAQLQRQKERLADYANQARFAVAQIHDRAHFAQESGHARRQ